ncbi:MAG: glycosyltransferase family 2 protein [Paludibacteraceae bacterium]|nr:glycosyltransferase family 2 protein [Paludibacteraceae bacterium]
MIIQPKISIIIPIYNVEEYITDCLQSVMRQTYQGTIECILVDDCGTDNSIAVAEQLIAEYKGSIEFCILHHAHNRGLSAARNTGTDAATGDYIYYLDSDDYISDDCLEVLAKPLKEREYDMVVGDLTMFGKPRPITFLPQEEGTIIGNENIFSRFYAPRMIYVMAWNKLVKASLFKQYDLSFLEGQLHEDELWTYKYCCAIQSLYVSKHITYYYRIRENSITAEYSRKLKKRLDSCYDTIDYVLAHPAGVEKSLFDECVVYYFGVYLRNVFDENFDYWQNYKTLRRRFDYHPYRLLLSGKLSKLELKRQLHFFLPTRLGYAYLKLKRIKNKLLYK